ncbi:MULTISPECIES: aspartate dehydrogenase domain-containing protein [Pandoraea]|uniref:aspartate dehydrogenase domain-containing protein n=1 Tax=Pandoraea TaxID=93217 RepID=UPI001F5D8A80|nr:MULTISPECIES: aspartate dehydrogenase domain-containing protein [Pandoraea]MCI3203526.1 aspartate dehydrogenase [Pandoraea sp. LA3]MDN4581552.1 aspartate dehydrogenase [Pandoraea capi]
MTTNLRKPLRIGIAGLGGVGQEIAKRLLRRDIPDAELAGVYARDKARATQTLAALGGEGVAVTGLGELVERCDIVCECATADAFPEIAKATLLAGKTIVAVSVAALPNNLELLDLAKTHGGRIRVASGGLPGLDAVRAMKEGCIHSIKLTTTFRPESLAKEPYVREKGFDFTQPPASPVLVFQGNAREAGAAFPRHFNVGITLSLAGVGFDATEIEVWVDPNVRGAVQHIEVRADDADLTLESRNIPSDNPRTSRIVAPSIMATLRSYVDHLYVGS